MHCRSRPPRIVLVIWMAIIVIVGVTAGVVIGARIGVLAGLLWSVLICVFLGGLEVTYFLLHDANGKAGPTARVPGKTPRTSGGRHQKQQGL